MICIWKAVVAIGSVFRQIEIFYKVYIDNEFGINFYIISKINNKFFNVIGWRVCVLYSMVVGKRFVVVV